MSLRLIEIIAPSTFRNELSHQLDEEDLIEFWVRELDGNRIMARVLLPTEKTEALSDKMSRLFAGRKGFRLVLYEVEATIPRHEEKQEPHDAPTRAKGAEKPGSDALRISREELYEDVVSGARLSRVYLVTVALSTLVAAVGLVRGNVALVIGAMVIAPLLGPNVALALAVTLGDLPLVSRSIRTLLAGLATAAVLSLLGGTILNVDPTISEIVSRTRLGIGDMVVALAAGTVGTLAFTGGIPATLVGVMVAVALLPPLVTAGLLAGSGYLPGAFGAIALLVTNLACIVLAGVITFRLQKVRPRTWWEQDKAKRATRIAVGLTGAILALLVLLILLMWRN